MFIEIPSGAAEAYAQAPNVEIGEMDMDGLKRTPLYDEHKALGAKLVPFAGWEMPVQYSGLIPEHQAVRTGAGIFDVSHMGELLVEGKGAFDLLQRLTCNDVATLYPGRAQYSALTNDKGGIVDDIIIYKYTDERYFICVNASNADRDFAWISKHGEAERAKGAVTIGNESARYGQIALQGPKAVELVRQIDGAAPIAELKYYHFTDAALWGIPVIAARTGYTGEDGFEFFVEAARTPELWRGFMEIGAVPCGLGARDTLRLEACYPLHGHELGEEITAIESGLGWIVKPEKGPFIGSEILANEQRSGAARALAGFFLDDAGIAREGTPIEDPEGKVVGVVTSGTKTPTLNRSLGLALVEKRCSKSGTELRFDVRGRKLKGTVVKRPFYKNT